MFFVVCDFLSFFLILALTLRQVNNIILDRIVIGGKLTMYTRCPSCRAEISFEPPANMESLPDGYKHRIKCPSCGVTIGVKINKIDTMPAQVAPQYNQPAPYEPVCTENESEQSTAKEKAVTPKHSGIGRNVTMMILSLLFVGLSVLGYFAWNGAINIGTLIGIGENNFGIQYLDGVTYWDNLILNTQGFVDQYFKGDILNGIIAILPMVVLTLAGINFIVAFISACGKKFGRAYNLISSLLIGVCSIATILIAAQNLATDGSILTGLTQLIQGENLINNIAFLVFAVLGLLQIILGLCFLKSLKRKQI